ncbi:MAG: hypothetical protein IKC79_01570 [Clostridia bacterium]|nr:hypothetical protein [Clostridia bacterium]
MSNNTQSNQGNEIIQDIKNRRKVTSGKFTKVIDGKTYVMHHDGGDYRYVPPYPVSLDGGNYSKAIDDNNSDNIVQPTKVDTYRTYHNSKKNINGKTYAMQHDGGAFTFVQPYPTHLDGGCYSRPIVNTIKKSTNQNTNDNDSTVSR